MHPVRDDVAAAAAAAGPLTPLTDLSRGAAAATAAVGFTFGSNVEGYLRLSTDVCDIKSAIGTGPNPPYAEARKVCCCPLGTPKLGLCGDGCCRCCRCCQAPVCPTLPLTAT